MNAQPLVQLKAQHHAPGYADAVPVLLLLERKKSSGKAVVVAWENDKQGGAPFEVDLTALRYVQNEKQDALARAVRLGHNRIVAQLLLDDPVLDPNGNSGLSLLSLLGDLPPHRSAAMFEVLIAHGADIDHHAYANDHGPHWTPFWNAVHDGNIDHAKRLLGHGASFDIPNPAPHQTPNYTVVHLAASCGLFETMMWLMHHPKCPPVAAQSVKDILLDRDDKVDPTTYGIDWNNGVKVPLLHLAASRGVEDEALAGQFVDWLLGTGEPWEQLDHNGHTAWEVAFRLNSGMRPIFATRRATSQAAVLDDATLTAPATSRRPRM